MFSNYFLEYPEYPEPNDVRYLEIDDFEDYEYANNLAYELAIRNDKILESLEKFEKHYIKCEGIYQDLFDPEEHIEIKNFRFLQDDGFDLFAMLYWLFIKRAKQNDKLSKLKNDELCQLCNNAIKHKDLHIDYENIQPLLTLFNPAFESGKILEGLSCKYIEINKLGITEISQNKYGRILFRTIIDETYSPTGWSTDIFIGDIKDEILPSIRYSLKRPILRRLHKNATFNLPINMEMDKKLFIDYMTKLKEEYDARKAIDMEERERLEQERAEYIAQSSRSDYEKKVIANATIMMYKDFKKRKQRVLTTTDIFGGDYMQPKKTKKFGSLNAERVKELLYTWDYLNAVKKYNKKLDESYETYKKCNEYISATPEEKKADEKYYNDIKIKKSEALDNIYKTIEGKEPTTLNHKIKQHDTLLNKLITNMEYKFLI